MVVRSLFLSLCVLGAASCLFDVPAGTSLSCTSNADCPALAECRAGIRRCVEAGLGEPRCGDGIVDVGEACDDGNTVEDDACTSRCAAPSCGDGVAQAPEACDDGNASNIDGCTNVCLLSQCGDGFVQAGEQCDDANTDNDDDCPVCATARCGDGFVLRGQETCDDGNTIGGDGCSAECRKVELCGDGVLDVGEGCDDGNDNDNDACHTCEVTSWTPEVITGLGPTGGDATATGLVGKGVAVDRHGNVFFSEARRVWKVDVSGLVSLVAGNGTFGRSGDGGPATAAEFGDLVGLAVDGVGNLFVADQLNGNVRRISADGIVTTVVGGGLGPLVDGDQATSGRTSFAQDVAVDGVGNLFIVERFRVIKVALNGTVSTVAGNGTTAGFSGDGGPATSGTLNFTSSVAVDSAGNLFIADSSNSRIRKVSTSGILTTVAGNGTGGFSGDGGPATAASLSSPQSVDVDVAGNLFIADSTRRLRKVATDGTISTVAGNGIFGSSGDGGPAAEGSLVPEDVAVDASGRLFIADEGNRRVRKVDVDGTLSTIAGDGTFSASGDGGQATAALLRGPSGLAVDRVGNLFITEPGEGRVRRVAADGTISAVAGNGTRESSGDGGSATAAGLDFPEGVATDDAGNLFITEGNRIRKVAPDGTISTVAGTGIPPSSSGVGDGGPAVLASINPNRHIAVDGVGNLFFSESGRRIRKVALDGTISTVAGNGTTGFAGDGGLATASPASPLGLAIDRAGNLYFADRSNHRIRKVSVDGTISTVAGNGAQGFSGDAGPATAASLNGPFGVSIVQDGSFFILDGGNNRIRKVTADGTISTVVGNGIRELGFSGDGGVATAVPLSLVQMAVDGAGNLFLADIFNDRIRKVATDGTITTVAGGAEPGGPFSLALLPEPTALVPLFDGLAVASQARVLIARLDGASLEVGAGYVGGSPASGPSRFSRLLENASGVAFDADASVLYVSERDNHVLRAIDVVDAEDVLTWTIRTAGGLEGAAGFVDGVSWVDARFDGPAGLAFDDDARVLYVADSGNHVVRAVDVDADAVTTVAGTPRTLGFFGDNGDALGALLFGPRAVTTDAQGNLFIADTDNHRVRKVDGLGVITTVIGDGTPASSGVGPPAHLFPVDAPLGLATDRFDNLYVTSTVAVRQVTAGADGVVSGDDEVRTVYGEAPRAVFPESATRCLTGVTVGADDVVYAADRCAGLLLGLHRSP